MQGICQKVHNYTPGENGSERAGLPANSVVTLRGCVLKQQLAVDQKVGGHLDLEMTEDKGRNL